jgi:hypothetical protein
MNNKVTDNTNKVDQQAEVNPLMAAYNPLPPQAEQPARFYWQEPWQEPSAQTFVQAAFEG